MDWWNVLVSVIIPILSVAIVFFVKRKLLWTAPLISTVITFAFYVAAHCSVGISLARLLSNDEWSAFFFLAMIIHFGIAVVLTLIAYFAGYILNKKHK